MYVGTPNIGDRERFIGRVNTILDSRQLSNGGPFVQELEAVLSKLLNVKHAIAVSNATIGLQIAYESLGLSGEIIMPSYTFIATAHAAMWQGIKPVFVDIDPNTHNIDACQVERLISRQTSAIVGVHLWGRPCETNKLERIAKDNGLKLIYDASHALGCECMGRPIGSFGDCEVFSLHATKYINSFEGGVITTNSDDIANKARSAINFGFTGYDRVESLGINGKMNEVCAAMGLTNIESLSLFKEHNKNNYMHYYSLIEQIKGIKLVEYDEYVNYQYIVVEIMDSCKQSRDQLYKMLHAHKIFARRYFWPGCHRMEPYASSGEYDDVDLKHTEDVSERVIVLPTGTAIGKQEVEHICNLLKNSLNTISSELN
jgi:dTDP-4-amino-4,6-dideoxygalactose transaminase